jgi:hypothetical protein
MRKKKILLSISIKRSAKLLRVTLELIMQLINRRDQREGPITFEFYNDCVQEYQIITIKYFNFFNDY